MVVLLDPIVDNNLGETVADVTNLFKLSIREAEVCKLSLLLL